MCTIQLDYNYNHTSSRACKSLSKFVVTAIIRIHSNRDMSALSSANNEFGLSYITGDDGHPERAEDLTHCTKCPNIGIYLLPVCESLYPTCHQSFDCLKNGYVGLIKWTDRGERCQQLTKRSVLVTKLLRFMTDQLVLCAAPLGRITS